MWIRGLSALIVAAGLSVPLLAAAPAQADDYGYYRGRHAGPPVAVYPNHRHYGPPARRVDWDHRYHRPHPHYPPPVYYRPPPPRVYVPPPVYYPPPPVVYYPQPRPPVVVVGPPYVSFDFDLYAR